MVDIAPPVYQLDGSRFQGFNCNCASDAMLIARSTHGAQRPTSRRIRTLTGDTSGGTNLRQVHSVNKNHYHIGSVLWQPIPWDDLMDHARNDRGFILQMSYAPLANTVHDCFRHRFKDNHSIWINHMTRYGNLRGMDPGADGRYRGCPKGYQSYKPALLKKAAGMLDLSGLGTAANRPLGFGKAYALLAPKGT
jgi:hypothetical protein